MYKFRILKGIWNDGKEKRFWWKFQIKRLWWWHTIYWTTFEETVKFWIDYFPDAKNAELALDKDTWKDGFLKETVLK